MVNANEDLLSSNKESFRSKLEAIGMNELIINQLPGTKTIDGIIGTSALEVAWGRYAPFMEYSDYSLTWIDFN